MYITETVLLLLLASLLVLRTIPALPGLVARSEWGLCLLVLLLTFALGQARWQMLPAWLLVLWTGWRVWQSPSPLQRNRGTTVLGTSALLLSAVLAAGMPVITLPAPAGPWPVGTTVLTLTDPARTNAGFGNPDARQLTVQLWYPGAVAEAPLRPLWADLYRGPADPVARLAGYLRNIPTHSRQDLPLAAAAATWPLLVYSHGLTLFPEQNTLLMEHLASYGYVVAAVGHTYMGTRILLSEDKAVIGDFSRLQAAMAESNAESTPELTARAHTADSRLARASIDLEYIEASQALNALMTLWVEDLDFVLDAFTTRRNLHPGLLPFAGQIDSARIGMLGMSFGGGAITEICKTDARCKAGVNLDGGIFGSRQRVPLQVPHLVLASPPNVKYFEYQLLTSSAPHHLGVIAGTTHADFMDLALLFPLLKWLGLAGPIDPGRMLALMNRTTERFFDAWLRDGKPDWYSSTADFPELLIETRNAGVPATP